jgi:hypothetical protein
MNKLFVLLLTVVYCLVGIAAEPAGSWILSNTGKMNMKKISFGISKARIILENGNKLTIPIDQICSYSINGKVFNKLPLYKDGKLTNRMVFMELIKTSGELSLYKYGMTNDFVSPNLQVINYNYFLYNGDKFQQELDQKSLPDICKSFGITCIFE